MIPVAILLAVCILMPLAFAWRILRLEEPTRTAWLTVAADASVFVALVMLLGRWDIAGYHLRIALAAIFVIALLVSLRRHAGRPWHGLGNTALLRRHWSTLLSLLVFAAALAYVAVGLSARDAPHPLAFPLQGGSFIVAQGGGNFLLNHHSGHREQTHAVDLTALNAAGFRAAGVLPDDPERYVVFGATVASPCEGTVVEAVDGLPDLPPPQADPENPAGNHVVLSCGALRVELAHLREGSLTVGQGDGVVSGQALGEVGNSGNTTEPHLHIHAVDATTGAGVQMAFDGVVPARNRVFRR